MVDPVSAAQRAAARLVAAYSGSDAAEVAAMVEGRDRPGGGARFVLAVPPESARERR